MEYQSQRFRFAGSRGQTLAGIVDAPRGQAPVYTALFAHCFTCTKDLKAIARISRNLVRHGIATLRFDFTGLGDSSGSFAETDFRSNVEDCLAAASWLGEQIAPPALLVGHSLGGAALLTAAQSIRSARAVVNIASPVRTGHLADFLARSNPQIEQEGVGLVTIGGRPHPITRRMVEVLRATDHEATVRGLRLPLLVAFSPEDETLPFLHAREMFGMAGGPVSFLTIDGADHLLVNQPEDVTWVADCIAVWAGRYCRAD